MDKTLRLFMAVKFALFCKVRVFAGTIHFHPSAIFESKSGAYHSEASYGTPV
jgi:hypothetical protein